MKENDRKSSLGGREDLSEEEILAADPGIQRISPSRGGAPCWKALKWEEAQGVRRAEMGALRRERGQ